MKVRKLAKQIGSKETVASILEDDMDFYDNLLESRSKKKPKENEKDEKETNNIDVQKLKKDNELMKLEINWLI